MVNLAVSLAALAMAASVAAIPATTATTFSFAQWVEDIIAHPDTALTVDEALSAAVAADVVGTAGGLQRRARCDVPGWTRAPGRDAAGCVDYLARLGRGGTNCVLSSNNIQMCHQGGAQIVASQARSETLSVNCNDVARTAGIIFDNCWRSDDTIMGSEICVTEQRMQINILGA